MRLNAKVWTKKKEAEASLNLCNSHRLDYVGIFSTVTWHSVSAHAVHRPSLGLIGDVLLGRVNESFMVYEVD